MIGIYQQTLADRAGSVDIFTACHVDYVSEESDAPRPACGIEKATRVGTMDHNRPGYMLACLGCLSYIDAQLTELKRQQAKPKSRRKR